MDGIRTYILSITAAAIISGILSSILGKKGTIGTVGTMLCGIFLSIAVVRPLAKIQVGDWSDWLNQLSLDAGYAVSDGEKIASDAMAAIIKSEAEAYILDKAASMELSLEVSVTVNNEQLPTPESVLIRGPVSPHEKNTLAQIIAQDLGIAKENQQWTG